MIHLSIDHGISTKLPQLHVGILQYQQTTVSDSPQMLKGRTEFFQESLCLEYNIELLAEIPQIEYYRSCFKKLGIDPKRYRPSSEALLKRVLQGKGVPSINSAADVNNFFSLRYIIPCGLYDLDQIVGNEITMRLGEQYESYQSLSGRETSAAGKWITADEIGPFGGPVVDSERTKVSHSSKNILHVIYLPHSIQNKIEGEKLLSSIVDMFLHINGGELVGLQVVSMDG
jgi:DNA/RNA-binding domain of Phe-tRNA-synthetase-like protein